MEMDKVNIKDLFKIKQEQMLGNFKSIANAFSHPVSRGDIVEKEWLAWFSNFPKRYKAEKAYVIDHQGNRSEQMDVVIYDDHFSPTIFEMNGEKYIPAESVYAVFEVKPELNKSYLEYAIKKIQSVKSLSRTSAPINTINGYVKGRPVSKILGGILTHRSDWKVENIENNIKKTLSEAIKEETQLLDFICCLEHYACALEYKHETGQFHGKQIFLLKDIETVTDKESGPLIFTYFKLLRMLQDLGNVPAIEYSKYGIKGIDPKII